MDIRKSTKADLPVMLDIYRKAKIFMVENGNPTQWADGYPKESMLEQDILAGNSYVCVENEKVVGTFAFIIGADPTYKTIERGAWHSTQQYGTIHRLASYEQVKGTAKCCFDFCKTKCKYLRVDTHQDNLPMQGAIRKYGFQECGIIYVADGTPRIAFDYISQV